MDVGKLPVTLPSISKINEDLNNIIKTVTTSKLRNILSDISEKYGIAKNELYTQYLNQDFDFDDIEKDSTYTHTHTHTHKIRKTRKEIPSDQRCLAKISSNTRCSRRKKPDSNYCGSHVSSRPNGEIELELEGASDVESEEFDESSSQPTTISITKK